MNIPQFGDMCADAPESYIIIPLVSFSVILDMASLTRFDEKA